MDRLVLIEWEDSLRPQPDWDWIADNKKPSVCIIRSVGWLIGDGVAKVLAPNIGGEFGVVEQASGVIKIPSRCVVRVTDLEEQRPCETEDAKAQLVWLVERPPNPEDPFEEYRTQTHYMCDGAVVREFAWTTDVYKARHFPRKEEAEGWIGNGTGLFARQHAIGLQLDRTGQQQ